MVQQIKVSVLLWGICSASSAMAVLLESPQHARVAPTAAAHTATPTMSFALRTLVTLADYGDQDGQWDSSSFEQAFASAPSRRADSRSFDDFAGPAAAIPTLPLRAIAPLSSAHYNPQQASGFNAALAATPAYGVRLAAVVPAPRPANIPAPTSYLPSPSAYPAAYPKVVKSVPGAGAVLFRAAPDGALPLQQPGHAAPFYPPRAAATGVSGTRFSSLHATSRGAGGGLGSSSLSSSQRAAPASAPAPQRDAVDLRGFDFGFGSELSSSAGGSGGFHFGSEQF
ncbi:Protein of unknown function [Gryllus bimaculatus]|nr:Protein of unknown function [Gryllus bimaculatus]